MKANQKDKRTPKQEEKRAPETIAERVHRHISDINSEITDDDIKSVKTELDIRMNPAGQPEEKNQANKKKKRNPRQNKKNKKDNNQPGDEEKTTPRDLPGEGDE